MPSVEKGPLHGAQRKVEAIMRRKIRQGIEADLERQTRHWPVARPPWWRRWLGVPA